MEQPKRIQRKRIKGWKMPPNTVSVTRPGKWGNPFKVGQTYNIIDLPTNVPVYSDSNTLTISRPSTAVSIYEKWLKDQMRAGNLDPTELRGKNIACFCHPDEWCHGDVLLQYANS
jgi:hypothetical protein